MNKGQDSKEQQLASLNQQLEAVKKLKPKLSAGVKPAGDAARGAIDFASATAVGCMVGYAIDRWQDSLPWGLLAGLTLGVAAGLKLLFVEEARQARADVAKIEKNTEKE